MKWNKDLSEALSIHKIMLNSVGVWPNDRRNLIADIRWILAVFIEASLLNVHFLKIYLHCHGANEILGSLTPCAAAMLALTRLIMPRIHKKELVKIITSIIEDWTCLKENQDRYIMSRYVEISKRVTNLMLLLVTFILSSYVTVAVTATIAKVHGDLNSTLPLVPFNQTDHCTFEQPTFLLVFTTLQAVQMGITCILTAGTTSFFFGLTMHLCGQFDILATSFEKLVKCNDREIVRFVVKRHCHLIELAARLERSFNSIVLMYLFVTAMLMCVEGFLIILSLKTGERMELSHHVIVLLLMLIQFSFYAVAGEYLETRSVSLSNAIYNYEWYDRSAFIIRDLSLVLTRASMPHRLTAGKFVSLNMITFKDILKSTASYLSVLRVMMNV